MYDASTEELYTIKRDVTDPIEEHAGIATGLRGTELGMQLDRGKIPVAIRWRDRISVADVFVDEAVGQVLVHMYCPNCAGGLSIASAKKRIRFNRDERRISMERIGCTYPGCGWTAVVENNQARSV